jgi:hypothetical protein
MPDPAGGERLLDYGCKVSYQKSEVLVPRKVYKPSDFRPGTKKGKIDPHPIWIVEVQMPKKLMQDIFTGKELKDHMKYAESMRTNTTDNMTSEGEADMAGASLEQEPTTEPTPNATV